MSKPATKSKAAPKKPATNSAAKKSAVKTVSNGALKKPATNGNGAAKLRVPMQPLEAGQVWQMAELNLQVGLVGKLLVHYKLAKPDAVRIANSVGGRSTVEKYLKTNKAVLIRLDKAAAAKANKV
jgi:hypothetical protein